MFGSSLGDASMHNAHGNKCLVHNMAVYATAGFLNILNWYDSHNLEMTQDQTDGMS